MRRGRKNRRTRDFKKQFDKLPTRVQQVAQAAFKRFLEDPFAPELYNREIPASKSGRHLPGTRSVTINYRYRTLYVEDGDTNVWYWIGSHEDYNDFIGGT